MADDNREVLTRGAPWPEGADGAIDPSALALPERLYDAIRSERRRAVLRCFVDTTERVVELDELVERVIARETGSGATSRPTERSVAISLHHKHLPILDRAGLIEYDARSGTIVYDCSSKTERQLSEALH